MSVNASNRSAPRMADLESYYKKSDGKILIEINLTDIMQIFETLDPFPFLEKELDRDAEEYITETVEEFPQATPLQLVFYLPGNEVPTEQAQTLGQAVRNHFAYRALSARRQLRAKFAQGRNSMIIGLSFLFFCLTLIQLIQTYRLPFLQASWITEGLLIIGWVAMWEPVTIFLYSWWPIRAKQKIYEKISRMDVAVLPSRGAGETA
jgi:hypothetical protein